MFPLGKKRSRNHFFSFVVIACDDALFYPVAIHVVRIVQRYLLDLEDMKPSMQHCEMVPGRGRQD